MRHRARRRRMAPQRRNLVSTRLSYRGSGCERRLVEQVNPRHVRAQPAHAPATDLCRRRLRLIHQGPIAPNILLEHIADGLACHSRQRHVARPLCKELYDIRLVEPMPKEERLTPPVTSLVAHEERCVLAHHKVGQASDWPC
eukprot:scaffold150602_cov35-Tisochrysis_lutea.AAC.3